MVGIALLGTGTFAQDVYPRLLKPSSNVELRCVWSRSQESADAYVKQFFPDTPGVSAVSDEAGLSALLSDPNVHLAVVVLPVQIALQVVQRCLAAGKCVVHEKPVAGTVEAALSVLRPYRAAAGPQPLWLVAENYRYEGVFLEASKRLASGFLGKLIKLDLVADLPMDARNKYHASAWRRDTSLCPGGFLMDSSVHFIAALRLLAHAAGAGEVVTASAQGMQAKDDLSPPDSVVGALRFAGGACGSVSITLASHTVRWSLMAVGTHGSLEVSRGGWSGSRGEYALTWQAAGEAAPSSTRMGFSGVDTEFSEFVGLVAAHVAGSLATDAGHARGDGGDEGAARLPSALARGSPEEGARDLALMEALLTSSQQGGGAVAVVQI